VAESRVASEISATADAQEQSGSEGAKGAAMNLFLFGAIVWVGFVGSVLIVHHLLRRRRRDRDSPVSPRWLNQNVYHEKEDRRWK
jgi:hypothetical protein